MKDVIYLVVSRNKVERMNKNLPQLYKGEYVVRVNVTVEENAFKEPTLTKDIVISDWRQGIDVSDVEFSEPYITEEEAAIIRERREAQLIAQLKAKGYTITKEED